MAKAPEKKEAKPAEAEAPPKSGKGKLILIIVVALVLIGGGVGGWLFFGHKSADSAKDAEKKAGVEKPPVFQELEQFTVNLKDSGVFLQINISLKVKDDKVQEEVKAHMPEIKDAIIKLLTNQDAQNLGTSPGKDQLKKDIQNSVNKLLGVTKPADGVSSVLFTSFIIQ